MRTIARRTARTTAAALVAVLLLMVLASCNGSFPLLPDFSGGTPAVIDPPGIYDASLGRVRALGVLDLVDVGEPRWAVVGVASTQAAESVVVVVIDNPDDLDVDLATLRGRYVEVTGTLLDASPGRGYREIRARKIRTLEAEVPE